MFGLAYGNRLNIFICENLVLKQYWELTFYVTHHTTNTLDNNSGYEGHPKSKGRFYFTMKLQLILN